MGRFSYCVLSVEDYRRDVAALPVGRNPQELDTFVCAMRRGESVKQRFRLFGNVIDGVRLERHETDRLFSPGPAD